MMVQALKVPDEVYEKYESRPGGAKAAMSTILTRFQDVAPQDRVLVVSKEFRVALERLLGTDIDGPEHLVRLVGQLLSVQVAGSTVTLTKDQAQRMKEQASFQGLEVTEYIKRQGEWAMEFVAGGGVA